MTIDYKYRYNYYISLQNTSISNEYLELFYYLEKQLNILKYDGTTNILYKNIVEELSKICNLYSMHRAWGYSKEIINIVQESSIITNNIILEIIDLLKQIIQILLEILPCFVPLQLIIKNDENKLLVDFLHNKSNEYRKIGDPNFYKYDDIVDEICKSTFSINIDNCKFLQNINMKIKQVIIDFLNSTKMKN